MPSQQKLREWLAIQQRKGGPALEVLESWLAERSLTVAITELRDDFFIDLLAAFKTINPPQKGPTDERP